jgi:hypothetical protein
MQPIKNINNQNWTTSPYSITRRTLLKINQNPTEAKKKMTPASKFANEDNISVAWVATQLKMKTAPPKSAR